jgi:hypothetical protein
LQVEVWDVVDSNLEDDATAIPGVAMAEDDDLPAAVAAERAARRASVLKRGSHQIGKLTAETIDVYQGASAVVLMYDVTEQSSFDHACELYEGIPDRVPVVLVGNKVDLCTDEVKPRRVTKEVAAAFAAERSDRIMFLEASMADCFGLRALHSYINVPYLEARIRELQRALTLCTDELVAARAEVEAASTLQEHSAYAQQRQAARRGSSLERASPLVSGSVGASPAVQSTAPPVAPSPTLLPSTAPPLAMVETAPRPKTTKPKKPKEIRSMEDFAAEGVNEDDDLDGFFSDEDEAGTRLRVGKTLPRVDSDDELPAIKSARRQKRGADSSDSEEEDKNKRKKSQRKSVSSGPPSAVGAVTEKAPTPHAAMPPTVTSSRPPPTTATATIPPPDDALAGFSLGEDALAGFLDDDDDDAVAVAPRATVPPPNAIADDDDDDDVPVALIRQPMSALDEDDDVPVALVHQPMTVGMASSDDDILAPPAGSKSGLSAAALAMLAAAQSQLEEGGKKKKAKKEKKGKKSGK